MAPTKPSAPYRKATTVQRGAWSPHLRGTSGLAKGVITTSPLSPRKGRADIRRRLKLRTDLAPLHGVRFGASIPARAPASRAAIHGRFREPTLPRSILKSFRRSGYARKLPLRSFRTLAVTPLSTTNPTVTWSPDDQVRLFKRGSVVSPYMAAAMGASTFGPANVASSSSPKTPTTPQRLSSLFSKMPVGRRDSVFAGRLGPADANSSMTDMLSAKNRRELGEKVHLILTRDGLHALFWAMASYNDEEITRPFQRFELRYLDGREWLSISTRSKVISLAHMMIDELGLTFPGEPDNETELLDDIRHAPDGKAELTDFILDKNRNEYQHDKWRSLWTTLMALGHKHGLEAVVQFALENCEAHVVSEMRNDPKALLRRGALHPASPLKSLAAVIADGLISMSQQAQGIPPPRLFEMTTYIGLDTPVADKNMAAQHIASASDAKDAIAAEVSAYCWICMTPAGKDQEQRRQHFDEHKSELARARSTSRFADIATIDNLDEDEPLVDRLLGELIPLMDDDDELDLDYTGELEDSDSEMESEILDCLNSLDYDELHDILQDSHLPSDENDDDDVIIVVDREEKTPKKTVKKPRGRGKGRKQKGNKKVTKKK